VCIRLTFALENGGRLFTFGAPFYNVFVAAVKEALWHADTGDVRARFWLVLVLLGHAKFDT
jgi:hypothetical protein